MARHRRLTALQRVLADDSTAPRVRVAACLALLFAEPAVKATTVRE
jgi:hypothetical protein